MRRLVAFGLAHLVLLFSATASPVHAPHPVPATSEPRPLALVPPTAELETYDPDSDELECCDDTADGDSFGTVTLRWPGPAPVAALVGGVVQSRGPDTVREPLRSSSSALRASDARQSRSLRAPPSHPFI